jgi:hypothetical protein
MASQDRHRKHQGWNGSISSPCASHVDWPSSQQQAIGFLAVRSQRDQLTDDGQPRGGPGQRQSGGEWRNQACTELTRIQGCRMTSGGAQNTASDGGWRWYSFPQQHRRLNREGADPVGQKDVAHCQSGPSATKGRPDLRLLHGISHSHLSLFLSLHPIHTASAIHPSIHLIAHPSLLSSFHPHPTRSPTLPFLIALSPPLHSSTCLRFPLFFFLTNPPLTSSHLVSSSPPSR